MPTTRVHDRRRPPVRAALVGLVLLLAHGCASRPAPSPATSPAPRTGSGPARERPRPGYDVRVDPLDAVDTTALAGVRIVLDPGHGGFFRGALGVGGLTEAEVNLGVSLHLRGLLEARGARVLMTRTDDRDFLLPTDSTLRSDLLERARIANAFAPDLFVSVHHNADARGAHDVNETQTYYKLGDEGPSLDASESIHRYLVRNLGIDRHRILPGNFSVLRNSDAPALLTESSYITNPDVESKLALASKQRLEAEALYLGIAHYFSRPRPRIEELVVSATPGGAADTTFAQGGERWARARVAGAFDRAELTLDGTPVEVERAGDRLRARLPAGAGGRHELTLRAALSGAGTARERRVGFTIDAPASRLEIDAPPFAARGITPVTVRAFDAAGFPAAGEATLRLRVTAGALTPADTTLRLRDGVAHAYLRARPGTGSRASLQVTDDRGAGATATLRRETAGEAASWRGVLRRMPGDVALAQADSAGALRLPAWMTRDGFATLTPSADGSTAVPTVPGYRRWGTDSLPPRYVAIGGGTLHGRRIVLDPDGGGENAAGTGRDGTRAANLNLDVARALAGFLEAAGAHVRLTRTGDFAVSDVERVEISESFRADRFLRIGHRAEPPMFGHYFSSTAGKRWAERTRTMFERLGLPAPATAEDAQYPLQQTSCPALYAAPARVDDPAAERRLTDAAAVRAEAYALFLGLLAEWAPDASWPTDSLRVTSADGRPAAGASVTLGGALVLIAGRDGWVRFARTEPGPIEVRIEHSRVRDRRVLVDFAVGVSPTGSGRP